MKVMCVNTNLPSHEDCKPGGFMPVELSVYNVKNVVNWYGENWYILAEDPDGYGWNITCFVPISEIDESIIHHKTITV